MNQDAIEARERHTHAGTWWLDLETRQLWWSSGLYALHGVDPEHYTPALETALAFFEPDSSTRLEAEIGKAVETGSGWDMVLQLRSADGELRHVRAVGGVEHREGRLPLLVGAKFEAAPVTGGPDASWRIAGENTDLGLLEIDPADGRCHVRGEFVRQIGLAEDAAVEMSSERWLALVHPDDREQRQQHLDAHVAGETSGYGVEYRLCMDLSEPVWVREAGRLMREHGEPARVVGTLCDISVQKNRERRMRESQRRLVQTLRHAPIGIALVSPDGHWLTANQALCEMIGYTETELLALTFQDITHADDLHTDMEHVADLLAGRARAYRMEKRYFHKQGHVVDIQLDVSLLRDAAGEPLYFISHIQDITEQKRAQHELFAARELAEVTFESIGEGVIRMGPDGRIVAVNSAASLLLVAQAGELVGQRFDEAVAFYDSEHRNRLPDPLAAVLDTGQRHRVPIFTRLRCHDGRYMPIVDSISAIHDENGGVRGAVFVFQDISEARRMTDQLVHQASHDALTGLPNRRGFEQMLARAWQRVCSDALPAFVLYLDLDHFKAINDSCGHAAGDELLRQVAVKWRSILRAGDTLARMGGDEFAAIVSAGDEEGAHAAADKFIRTIGDLDFTHAGRAYEVGVSIGIAALEADMPSSETALTQADAALYVAKNSGRNRYHRYQVGVGDDSRAPERFNTAQLLRSGLEQNLFTLYLQAIVDARGQRIGYESLLRFEGPDGVVAPDVFLPTARRLGMMARIDRWVVAEALALVGHYDRRGLWPRDCFLTINLSPVSLSDAQFHAELISLLDQHAPDARRFVFEITESEALFGDDYPQLIQNLRDRGFLVWLDDFASGYNGFDTLKHASFDGIKIDRGFVQGIEHDPIDRAVIRSIGDVSEALSLRVIAEGVETRAVFELLIKAGISRFQGYLFHRPEAAESALVNASSTTVTG